MSGECKIVRELIPLKQEELLGRETEDFVKEHVAHCDGCRKVLSQAENIDQLVRGLSSECDKPVKGAKRRIRRRRMILGLAAGALALVIFFTGLCWSLFGLCNPIRALSCAASARAGETAYLTGGAHEVYFSPDAYSAENLAADLGWRAETDKDGLTLAILPDETRRVIERDRALFGVCVWHVYQLNG